MPTTIMLEDAVIGDVLSFSTYGNNVLLNADEFTLIGVVAGTELSDPAAAAVNHANIWPVIPEPSRKGHPDNYEKSLYLVLRNKADEKFEVAFPWIVSQSVRRAERGSWTVAISDMADDRVEALKEILRRNDYTVVSMTKTGSQ